MRRPIRSATSLNLDPLMDVVTNVVGVMLFVVIFAVMAARSTAVHLFTPLLARPAENRQRVLFLCTEGRIRRYDWDMAFNKAAERAKGLTFDGVPKFVDTYNALDLKDDNFTYRLSYATEDLILQKTRKVFLIVDERSGTPSATGDDGLETFGKTLEVLSPEHNWIVFLVDEQSIDVYRRARDRASAARFAIGWDPGRRSFPDKECILGCGRGSTQPGVGWGTQN
jgi:hypothetical protein